MSPPSLPRRAYLGLDLERPPSTTVGTPERGAGLVVVDVAPDSPAARAGIQIGDVMLSANGSEVSDVVAVQAWFARQATGRPLQLRLLRESKECQLELTPDPMPLEPLLDGRVELAEVPWRGHLLRAVWTLPAGPGPYPAVWLLPGSLWMSEEQPLRPWYPTVRLVQGLTQAGFATLRVDRSGLGDSDGPSCTELDLHAELSMWEAALGHFCSQPWVNGARRHAYARSLGGMLLPLIPGLRALRSLAVWGTSPGPWHEAMLANAEEQYRLAGMPAAMRERRLRELEQLQRLVYLGGLTPRQVHASHPELAAVEPSNFTGEYVYARVASFFQQLQCADVGGAWRRVTQPVLAFSGSADWLCLGTDAAHIAALAPWGKSLTLPQLDHHMHRREGLEEAIREPWGGDFDPSALEALVDFYRETWNADAV